MLDCLIDGLIDTLKIIPFLFVTFLILEFIEHKLSEKAEKSLTKNRRFGPFFGAALGILPQCGFSAMAANLFSNHIITIGTLIAIFLSTSDEMLPLMLSENANPLVIFIILSIKFLVGLVIGLIIDLIYKKRNANEKIKIEDFCEKTHCHCNNHNVFISSLIHTLKISLFILIANLIINLVIFYVGEENFSNLLLKNNLLAYFLASLIGLIPNCASSTIITKLFLSNLITPGVMLAGLLTASGLGLLLLFKTNKNLKENFIVLFIVYFVGVFSGALIDFLPISNFIIDASQSIEIEADKQSERENQDSETPAEQSNTPEPTPESEISSPDSAQNESTSSSRKPVENFTINWGELMLINPNFTVSTDWIAERKSQLINIEETYGIYEGNIYNGAPLLDPIAASHLAEMANAYKTAYPGHELSTRSCFRSVGTSCGRLCYPTGTSDHHTGYTCDLIDDYYGGALDTDLYDQHPEWQWLHENSYKYGFIDRFVEYWAGGSMDEPINIDENGTTGLYETWHYRYVGLEAANDIATGKYNNGIYDSLEHYLKATGKLTNLLYPSEIDML